MRNPSVSIVGLGYVGLTTAACFASRGIRVVGVDVDEARVRRIRKGEPVIRERGLQPLLDRALRAGRLELRTDFAKLNETDVSFITVGTPGRPDGSIDTGYVEGAAREIGRSLRSRDDFHLVVVKSTVVPGTTVGRVKPILETESKTKVGDRIGLAVSPEFLYEGSAVRDTLRPEALVVGVSDKKSSSLLLSLYRRFYGRLPPTIRTTPENAELIKYSINAVRALQVSYVNFLANICSRIEGGEMRDVVAGLARVARLDKRYLGAGLGYGGSCVPPGTRIVTDSGFRPISSIEVGDRVLSHDGHYHVVTKTFVREFNGMMYLFKSQGFTSSPLLVTPKHPIYTCMRNIGGRARFYETSIEGRGLVQKLSNLALLETPSFADPSSLSQGDFMVLPHLNEELEFSPTLEMTSKRKRYRIPLSPDLMYLFGLWLAEGSVDTKRGEVFFSFHAKESYFLKEIDDVTRRYFGVKAGVKKSISKGNSMCVRVKCAALSLYVERTFGRGAENKHIPWDWLRLSPDLLIPLVRGMWYGDGSNHSSEQYHRFTYATASRNLGDFMEIALLKLRIPYRRRAARARIGKDGVRHLQSYYLYGVDSSMMNRLLPRLKVLPATELHRTSWFEGDNFVFPIKEARIVKYHGDVCNLEVEGSNSYVVEGATLHNCLPKDTKALSAFAESIGVDASLLGSVIEANERQAKEAVKMARKLVGDLNGKKVAVLGLAFKAGTDDVRESTAIRVIGALLDEGANVMAYDPEAVSNARSLLGDKVTYAASAEECITGTDLCIVTTGWEEFKVLKPSQFQRLMRSPAVVDGRRIFDPKHFRARGVPFLRVGTAANAFLAREP